MKFSPIFFLLVPAIHASNNYCKNGMCEKVSLSHATNKKQNFTLVGYVIETFSSFGNWKQCFNVCLKNCQCLSFNFNEVNTTENCELNDANTKLEPEALRKKEGVGYYELVRSYNDMKVRNLSRTCFKVISAYVLQVIKNLPQADKQLAQKFVIQFKSLGKRFGPTCH